MTLAYAYLGVWPLGERSVMTVDMHHQYAPLLAQLRDMIINGGSPFYTFEVGLGASFIPLFGYYLASPFNLLLVLFPKSMLNEGILVITLLKNAITAGLFALCVQYIPQAGFVGCDCIHHVFYDDVPACVFMEYHGSTADGTAADSHGV